MPVFCYSLPKTIFFPVLKNFLWSFGFCFPDSGFRIPCFRVALPDMRYAGKQLNNLKLTWFLVYSICVAKLKETINLGGRKIFL